MTDLNKDALDAELTPAQMRGLLQARVLDVPAKQKFHSPVEEANWRALHGKTILPFTVNKGVARRLAIKGFAEKKFVGYIGTVFVVTDRGRAAIDALIGEKK